MSLPGGGIFVVKGEMSVLLTAMRRGARWSSHSYQDDEVDNLMKNFQELKENLNKIVDLRDIEPNVFLTPFLNVIKSDETTGPVTSLALSSVNKFLSYGLITRLVEIQHPALPMIVHNIADAVTHARFVGTDQSSDGVVLMRILQVLRTLTLAPEGSFLSNESLCEIMLSCFRICFETRLNELLRKTAEHYLKDMVQLVFMRLPQFSEDLHSFTSKQFKMRPGAVEQPRTKRKSKGSIKTKKNIMKNENEDQSVLSNTDLSKSQSNSKGDLATTPLSTKDNIVDMQGFISQTNPEISQLNGTLSSSDLKNKDAINSCNIEINIHSPSSLSLNEENCEKEDCNANETTELTLSLKSDITSKSDESQQLEQSQEYVNQRGIRFTPQSDEESSLLPYGLACVKELFRFLISLCNPHDKQNTDVMIHLGLTLLTVAFEIGADSIGKFPSLMALLKDDLCRNLFSLLNTERLPVFAADLQVSFLMFESLRSHLKFQLEFYLTKLIEVILSESLKVTYEHKEMALDNILQLWRIPGLVTELYLNYDCDMYCTNLYEDLTKLLAKNAFSATSGVYHTHLLSLDALLLVIEGIEQNCESSRDEVENGCTEVKINGEMADDRNRLKISENVPPKDVLMERKSIKKWLPTGTEHFNHKPKKGIQFFQEHGILKSEFDPNEIALFLKENPGLDKKMIGEYISNRNNLIILEAYVKTFDFRDLRIDEALRTYLESFRLPGEAPTISLLLEHFAEHWHKSNGEPFADVDSAFTLAYAIIMLNVDQHNQNAKKQTTPMTASGFKKNLAGVNGGGDFDEEMLDEIYNTIKNDEIVMPAEQTGLVRDNYLWKVLIRKGASKDGVYFHTNSGIYDKELFSLIWAPVLSALSFVYDRSEDPNVYKRAIKGFENCAFICSHHGLTSNLDMLILTLCKFTTFHNQQRQSNGVSQFATNVKAQLALRTVFNLVHQHGDNLRHGWKNIFDIILSVYSYGLCPKSYIEVEDFIETSGKITLVFKEVENLQKQDTGLFSSLYSYMVSSENLSKIPSAEEQEMTDVARKCIKDCNLEQLVTDSKFLHEDALLEMVQALVELSRGPDVQKSLGYNYNENVTVFFLELLIRIMIQNRDRVISIWQMIRDHIYTLVMNASLFDYQFLLERSVIGLLRVAIRLMRNEDMSPIVLQSLRMLLLLKSSTLCRISRQISFGLYELLKTSAQNIHTNADWTIIFTLLECVGAGAQPPKPIAEDNQVDQATKSDSERPSDEDYSFVDRGYTSDSELTKSPKNTSMRSQSPVLVSPTSPASNNSGGWIFVSKSNDEDASNTGIVGRTMPPNQYNLALEKNLGAHDPSSLIKCCESLAFLVRDVAHITPYNFDVCVHCIRTFVEASLHGTNRSKRGTGRSKKRANRRQSEMYNSRRSPTSSPDEDESSDEESVPTGYHQISIQLLDLMHTLHTRTAQIFKWWSEEGGEMPEDMSLWTHGWCPLLQGIARLCCDIRKQVRMVAITYLQRALLVPDLQTLSGPEWEACFHRVLFPLLSYLLLPINPKDVVAMEETRMRAATLLSKVFLHHLTPLLSLPTFNNLWLIILDFVDKYMHADKSDLLYEAIPESLKNMLLVMDSARVFEGNDGRNQLWHATWCRIDTFLPDMKEVLFRQDSPAPEPQTETNAVARDVENKEPSQARPVQHNIENATRSSIILQPPPVKKSNISSPLFAHLGQMVSTPIGPVLPPDMSQMSKPPLSSNSQTYLPPLNTVPLPVIPNSTAPLLQPTLQPGMPYMPNLFVPAGPHHTFPVLYNQQPVVPATTPPTEVQPMSLYAEYMGNPYNVTPVENFRLENENKVGEVGNQTNETQPPSIPTDTSNLTSNDNDVGRTVNNNNADFDRVANNNGVAASYFQSSNYFSSQIDATIPPGSEILYATQGIRAQGGICASSSGSKISDI
ncbi:Golgi-specific brefeldin A-resistance guanine nucleotide exchange factor 1 [Harmonia axyridis]|uniref:Golgi-specific brefeldin A-resistance guanine nucleotide exchange factor 1 n=1 Tax=Harmonia axyridis TaxID=115357 RepID=UPI001E276C79|nr:Golgi-specific brefeldin A-resistance guanine nucleotide exchange factor 1 [Harmonia axyridis]